jgi:hypothetical protein
VDRARTLPSATKRKSRRAIARGDKLVVVSSSPRWQEQIAMQGTPDAREKIFSPRREFLLQKFQECVQ